ncbi:MAG TPA: glycosyltransferase, partial [Pirellulaceae bacterium]|nr:glycosyltransferase [Pirellulaceae bacterium]
MKILLCHNHYQRPGGEDQVFDDETRLLTEHGHDVERFTKHNDELRAMSRLGAALRAVWNGETYRELRRVVARFKPAVVHFTNTFPLISPAAYYAVRAEGVPVVQTLHNFRILCPNALLLRDGAACEACVGRAVAWPSIVHGCYRDSRLASAAVAAVAAAHRAIGTWGLAVDRYIALSEFARERFIAGGLPASRISVKPNCVHPDPGRGTGEGGHFVFVGRLSPEKGLNVLLDAWSRLSTPSPESTQPHASHQARNSRPITLEILG